MKEIYCIVRIPRTRRKVKVSGKTEYVPKLPLDIEIGGTKHDVPTEFHPRAESGWRSMVLLGARARTLELGKVGETSDWLYLFLIPEALANVVRHLSEGTQVWTLREFLAGFSELPAEVREAWPAGWYAQLPIEDPSDVAGTPETFLNLARPRVRGAPAARASLLELGADAPADAEWDRGSTKADAEEAVKKPEAIR